MITLDRTQEIEYDDLSPGCQLDHLLRREDEWLVLESGVPEDAATTDPFKLLVCNAALPAGLTCSITRGGALRLRADWPVFADGYEFSGDPGDAETALYEMIAEEILCAPGKQPAEHADLSRVCALSGWPCRDRGDGTFAVELERRATATIAPAPGGILATIDLMRIDADQEYSATRRRAIGTFLLRLAGSVRMVRPVAVMAEAGIDLSLQAYAPIGRASDWLLHILGALSTAFTLAARECEALCSDRIADVYLASAAIATTENGGE